jgi:hypothetical protein
MALCLVKHSDIFTLPPPQFPNHDYIRYIVWVILISSHSIKKQQEVMERTQVGQ